MSAKVFVDTNVLVYARDNTEIDKQRQARVWIEQLWNRRCGRISFQVLQEYYVTVTRKLNPGMSTSEARDDVTLLLAWQPTVIDEKVLSRAWGIEARFSISWWDSLIVAAAKQARCDYLLTEDLQSNQDLDGLRVISPFSGAVETVFAEIWPESG